jgi:hypothetical protein
MNVRQERRSAREIGGNVDPIYFGHDFLITSA